MEDYPRKQLNDCVEEMFIGPFGSSLKNEAFVSEEDAFCMVYEQKHAIKKRMNVETRYINKKKYEELKRFCVKGGDIIVSCRGTIGETFIVPDDAPIGIMHPSIMKIRLKKEVYDASYFNLLLCYHLKKHEAKANGSGVKMAMSAKELGGTRFPVPRMDQQRRVATIFSELDRVVDYRKQQLEKLDELVKVRFVEMFGDVAQNPNGYPIKDFDEISILITDGEHATPRRTEKGIYLLSARNILNHKLQLNDVDYIDEDEYDRIARRVVPQTGDILISCSGSIGRCCVVPNNLKFQMVRSAALIRFNNTINPVFAEWLITSDELQRQIAQSATQSSQANLFQGKIRKLHGYVPPMELQSQFAIFVAQTDKSKAEIEKSLEQLETLKKALMQKYFG